MNITGYIDNPHSVTLPAATVFLRKNLIAADATERYYSFVGRQSAVPFDRLIHEEDAPEFVRGLTSLKDEQKEHFIVRMYNVAEEYRMTYITACLSNKYEDGERLYELKLHDIVDMTEHYVKLESNNRKYGRFLMMSTLYFFEYSVNSGIFKIYKYVNDRSVMLVEEPLDTWCEGIIHDPCASVNIVNQINSLRSNLKKGVLSFDIEMEELKDHEKTCRIKGLPFRFYNEQQLSVGIISSANIDLEQNYYITPAAKDSGTGLLNKRAVAEYIISRLQKQDGMTRWLIIFDIDNFKGFNDRYGHLFGDRVIQMVADTIVEVFKKNGVVGRYGGDEFLAFVEGIESEEEIRTRLRTTSKHLHLAFADEPEYKVNITLSIGVTRYPMDGTDYQELFAKADKALYIAKDKGKSRYIIYNEEKHGNYALGNAQIGTVEYSVSGKKRTSALSDIMISLATEGTKKLISGEIQNLLTRIFDLDGVAIYCDRGRKRFGVTGAYSSEIDSIIPELVGTGYYEKIDENGIYVNGSMDSIEVQNPRAFELAKKMELGAYIHCVTYDECGPAILVMFDIFNRNRKWSDADTEQLSVIGRLIGRVIALQE